MTPSTTPMTPEPTNGPTWKLWHTDRCDELSFGALGFPADGRDDSGRTSDRNARFDVDDAAARRQARR
jgi:hypothetical protein